VSVSPPRHFSCAVRKSDEKCIRQAPVLPPSGQRSALFGIVITAHLTVFLVITRNATVAPRKIDVPMMVELLAPTIIEKQVAAKPLPRVKSQPQPHPVATSAAPIIEATQSAAPTVATPLADPPALHAAPASAAISQARFDADYLQNPPPPYPSLSRRMGEEGKVLLRVAVNPQGRADSVEIRTSSGSSRLDESARKTVLNWKFIPAQHGEVAVSSWVLVPIIFKLEH